MSWMRIVALVTALTVSTWWGFVVIAAAFSSVMVIADSDLGAAGRQLFNDAGTLLLLSLTVTVITSGLVPWRRLRLCLLAAIAVFVSVWPIVSPYTTHRAAWSVLSVIGIAVAAEYADARAIRGGRFSAFYTTSLAVLVSALLVMTDAQWLVYRGQLPSQSLPATRPSPEGWKISVGLLDLKVGRWASSLRAGLEARGAKDGTLTLRNLTGGPALVVPPTGNERMLDVLAFSPDGQTLAVADNDRMYKGSVITIWDVSRGDDLQTPPQAVQRYTLRGNTHYTFSLDFFPDGRTLISANGDGTVRLWDAVDGREKGRWNMSVDCVAATSDGLGYAAWGRDGITLWALEARRPIRKLDAYGLPCRLSFSPDGRYLEATDRESEMRWELKPTPAWFIVLLSAASAIFLWLLWERTSPIPGTPPQGK